MSARQDMNTQSTITPARVPARHLNGKSRRLAGPIGGPNGNGEAVTVLGQCFDVEALRECARKMDESIALKLCVTIEALGGIDDFLTDGLDDDDRPHYQAYCRRFLPLVTVIRDQLVVAKDELDLECCNLQGHLKPSGADGHLAEPPRDCLNAVRVLKAIDVDTIANAPDVTLRQLAAEARNMLEAVEAEQGRRDDARRAA